MVNSDKVIIQNFKGPHQHTNIFQRPYVLQADGTYRGPSQTDLTDMIWNEIFEDDILFELNLLLDVAEPTTIKIWHQPQEITKEQNQAIKQMLKQFKKKSFPKPNFSPPINPTAKSETSSALSLFKNITGAF